MSIRIITDSASDILRRDIPELTIIPMTVTFGDRTYQDGVNLSHTEFYEKLIESDTLPVTSQVNPGQFEDIFRSAVESGETVIAITLSSKLSGTYQSACIAAEEFPGKVYVVDSLNAAIGQQILVLRALELLKEHENAEKIVAILNHEKQNIRLVALLDTLEYLKRGGRLSKGEAVIGGILSIKPVVCISDGLVKVLGKARGSRNGNNLLIQQIQATTGIDFSRPYTLGYTGTSDHLLRKYIDDSTDLWQGHTDHLPVSTIGGTIGTHIGPGGIAVAFFCK